MFFFSAIFGLSLFIFKLYMKITLKFLEAFFDIQIYPCYKDNTCLSKEQFTSLNQEIRALAQRTFGMIPEYQCFLKDYDAIKDKLLVVHRNKEGKLDGFSSSVILKSPDKNCDIMHLGIYIVSPEARHQHIQFKLGLAATGAFMALNHLKSHYWFTNLSSVLGTLAIVDKMYFDVYPGLKKSTPDKIQVQIAKQFQNDVVSRCYINPNSQFDSQQFVYRNANVTNCFLKKKSDTQFHSLNNRANLFYSQIADLDKGDAILQVCKCNHFYFYLALIAYFYRVTLRDFKMRHTTRRKHV